MRARFVTRRSPIVSICAALACLLPVVCLADDPRGIAGENDVAMLKTSRLEAVIGNNKSLVTGGAVHRAGYNGLFALRSVDQRESPFVPAYAGLNLEHYFDARNRGDQSVFFEPRHAEMTLKNLSEKTVELHQGPTPTFGVESWTRFEVREPYYIDFTFRCTPRRDDYDGDFLGVFWASYINGPLDKSMYFVDGNASLDRPIWRQLCTQQHNRDSTVRSVLSSKELRFREPNQTLFASKSPLRYSAPFFYGRFRNMVLIYVFRENPNLRFTHSPSGGGISQTGDDTNPAWDFQLIVPQPKADRQYGLSGRLIYKPWQGRDDVLAEVKKFQAMLIPSAE